MPSTEDDHQHALNRIRAAAKPRGNAEPGAMRIRFDPRAKGYQPTPDLDLLNINYEVALMRSTDGASAWYEARFQLPPDTAESTTR